VISTILIFGRRPLGELEETCDEVAFETMLQTREDIQPLVHTLADFSHPDSSFVRSVLRKGKELYSMPAEKLKRAEIEAYYELATIYFDAAKRAFDPENEGSLRLAIDGAYNAIELCAKGFLRHEVEALPKPDSGVVTLFRDRWVKRGCLPREFGRRLSRSLKLRNDSRYNVDADISAEKAQAVVDFAEEILRALEQRLTKGEKKSPKGRR